MRPIRRLVAAAAICVHGVAACAVATPTPMPLDRASAGPTVSATTHETPPDAGSPAAADDYPLDLGRELDPLTVDSEFAATVLEHASTGAYVLLSSGPDTDASPDLWGIAPGPSIEPVLLWRNEHRDHSLVKLGGDLDTIVFVDMPTTGEIGWNLWLIPEDGAEAILLDTQSTDPAVPSFVPSFAAYQPRVAWTAFDAGTSGPVSQLLVAEGPDWQPRIIAERSTSEAELWFPSLFGDRLVFSEVRYSADRLSDDRHAYLVELDSAESEPVRLDTSGLATMPLINQFGIVWKEAEPGFNMLNWGRMYRYDPASGAAERIGSGGQEYVNHPSIGERFVAWWGEDPLQFEVYDLERGTAREIVRFGASSGREILRPHVGGRLLVWRELVPGGSEPAEIRFSWLPGAGDDRLNPP